MKDKKRLVNCLSQIRGDQGDLTTKFNMRSWIESWNRKGAFMEKLVKAD